LSLSTFMTERLHLRPLEQADETTLQALTSDPEVMRFVGDNHPMSLAQTHAFLNQALADHATKGYGAMAILRRGSLEWIGYCGLWWGEDTDAIELNYALHKKYWGRGYALEAARAVLERGFFHHHLERVQATADPHNRASFKVLEVLGFIRTRMGTDVHGLPTAYFTLERNQS